MMNYFRIILIYLVTAGTFARAATTTTAPAATSQPTSTINTIDPAATRITAKLKEVSAAALFDEIAKQAGGGFKSMSPSFWDQPGLQDAVFSAEFDRQLFWDAIGEASAETGVHVVRWYGGPSSREPLTLARHGKSLTSFDGPVLFVANSIERGGSVSYLDPLPPKDSLRLTMQAMFEPKFGNEQRIGTIRVTKAVDDKGNSLAPPAAIEPAARSVSYFSGFSGNAQSIVVPLVYPAGAGKQITELAGEVDFIIPSKIASADFPEPASGQSTAFGEDTISIGEFAPPGAGGPRIELRLTRGKSDDAHWIESARRFAMFGARVTLMGKDGLMSYSGGSGSVVSRDVASVPLNFSGRGDKTGPLSLHVEMPVEMQTLTAKFQFKDLPLP